MEAGDILSESGIFFYLIQSKLQVTRLALRWYSFFFFFGFNFVHNGKNMVSSPKSVYIYLSGTWKIEQS